MAEDFSTKAKEMLDQIYEVACGKPMLGSPALMLPPEKILRDTKGRLFIDLRLVLDLIKMGLPPDTEGSG